MNKPKNKQKENKFGEVNYADATNDNIQCANPKIKFSDLQERMKKNTHNKKINEILYDVPNSILYGYPFLISPSIQNNCENKNSKNLNNNIDNDNDMNNNDNNDDNNNEYLNEEDDKINEILNIHNDETNQNEELWEKYFGSRKDRIINFVKYKKTKYDKYHYDSHFTELEEQILYNYLYPFYHLNNNFDYDVMQKINNISDRFVLLK